MYTFEESVKATHHGLLVPMIMTDEYFFGYSGRVCLLNGFKRISEINDVLIVWIQENQRDYDFKVIPLAFSLAELLEMDVNQFATRNTLAPIVRCFKSQKYLSTYSYKEGQLSLFSLRGDTTKIIKNAACFCSDCVSEDVALYGFSYWRRSHQLAGVDWCLKHGTLLYEVPDFNAYCLQPELYLNKKQFNKIHLDNYSLHPTVSRFVQIMINDLDQIEPQSYEAITKKISDKLKSFCLRTDTNYRTTSLVEILIQKVPSDWLSKHFPKFYRPPHPRYRRRFDGLARHKPLTRPYLETILGLAVLD